MVAPVANRNRNEGGQPPTYGSWSLTRTSHVTGRNAVWFGYRFSRLTHLNLGTLATNSILKAVSETCSGLVELRLCGGGGGGHCGQSKVGDLGLRYIAGLVPTVGQRVRKLGKKE